VAYTVRIVRAAALALNALPSAERKNLTERIAKLATDQRPPDSKALKGSQLGHRRLRAGDYRAIYRIVDAQSLVNPLS
jgi:mRNA-degrading endonuclease RelE of RelBE toxin-antitoxin system